MHLLQAPATHLPAIAGTTSEDDLRTGVSGRGFEVPDLRERECGRQGSNLRPRDYESPALTS